MRQKFQLFLVVIFSTISLGLMAQNTVSGKITDAETGTALIGANVVIQGTSTGTITDLDGNFSLSSSQAFPWNLDISYTGYTDQNIAVANTTSNLNISLASGILFDESVVVSASRRAEKVQNAPSSVSVIGAKQISQTAVTEPLDLMRNTAGVKVNQQSAGRFTIDLRGQSQTFFNSGLYVAKDYKPLTNPGNGTFFSSEQPLNPLDIEKVEVVRGPGSALYGPGVLSGVVHFLSKSPFKHPGTSIEVGAGTLNAYNGAVRHAGANDKGTFGYKINANYQYSDEWDYDIYNDPDLERVLGRMRGIDQIASVETGEILIDNIQEDGLQDYFEKFSVDAALHFRKPSSNDHFVLSGGYTQADALFLTTNNIGVNRPQNKFVQARGSLGNTFASLSWTNSSTTGAKKNNMSAFYRATDRNDAGQRVIATTQGQEYGFIEAQIQHRLLLEKLSNTEIVFGGEARLLDVNGVIYGRNTGNTPYNLFGGYAQSKTALSDKLDMVLALRYDYYEVLSESSIAPRVAFVYKPTENGSFRLSYNQAYSTPSALNFYIDLNLGPVSDDMGNILAWERLIGNAYEQHTYGNPMVDWGGNAGAIGNSGLSLAHADALATAAAAAGLTINTSSVSSSTDLSGNIVASNGSASSLRDAETLKLQKNSVYEIGYTGKIGNKLKATIDFYYSDIENASAVNTGYGRFISNAGLANDVKAAAAGLGLGQADLDNLNVAVDNLFAGSLVGAVLSDEVQGDETLGAGRGGNPFVPRQYFSASAIDYLGYDIQLIYPASDALEISLNYSGLSETEFVDERGARYLLNTPQNKLRGGFNYSVDKWSANIAFQYNEGFEILNGTYSGLVDDRFTVDLGAGYQFNDKLSLVLTANNIFNQKYQAFPGAIKVGSQVLGKIRYQF